MDSDNDNDQDCSTTWDAISRPTSLWTEVDPVPCEPAVTPTPTFGGFNGLLIGMEGA